MRGVSPFSEPSALGYFRLAGNVQVWRSLRGYHVSRRSPASWTSRLFDPQVETLCGDNLSCLMDGVTFGVAAAEFHVYISARIAELQEELSGIIQPMATPSDSPSSSPSSEPTGVPSSELTGWPFEYPSHYPSSEPTGNAIHVSLSLSIK